MRLRDMLVIVKDALPVINSINFVNEGYSYTVVNIRGVNDCFKTLAKIKLLKKDIDLLLVNHQYLISDEDMININKDKYAECQKMIRDIKNKCNMISALLTQIIRPQSENAISFKLYKFENFSEFTGFCEDLNKKILIPLNRLNIDIRLGELETGSSWLSIVCDIGLGVLLLTAIVRAVFDILIHDYEKLKTAKSITESMQLGNEFIEKYNEEILKLKEKMRCEKVDQIVKELKEEESFPLKESGELSEFMNSVKLSMEILEKHIDKGLEVYQALDVKENERYKLPDFTKLIALKQPQKLITDSTEDTEASEKETTTLNA